MSEPWQKPRNLIGVGLEYIIAGLIGPVSVLLPMVWRHDARQYTAPIAPFVRSAIENLQFDGILLLCLTSFILGLAARKANPYKLGLATMVVFPCVMFLEMAVDPRSHSLFPFELFMYCCGAVLSALFVRLGSRVRPDRRRETDGTVSS